MTAKHARQSAPLPRTRSDTSTLTATPQSVAESVVAHALGQEAHASDGECKTADAPTTAASPRARGPKRAVNVLALDCVAGMQKGVLKVEMGRIPHECMRDYTRACVMGFIAVKPCTLCGLDLDLVGKTHRCVPRVANNPPPVVVNVANAVEPMANTKPDVANTYRYRDVEKRRSYMRTYMAEPRRACRSSP